MGKEPARPLLTAEDSAVLEGNSGITNLVFTLSLSQPDTKTVMVDYATRDVTAHVGSDYWASYGVAIFPPGVTRQNVTVSIRGDLLNEPDETFWLMLTNAVNARLLKDHVVGTILNDDPPPGLSIADAGSFLANGAVTNASFAVRLSSVSEQMVTVDFITGEGSARSGSDFVPVADILTFVPGTTLQILSVPVTGEHPEAPKATFFVTLTNPVNATIARAAGWALITSPELPALSRTERSLALPIASTNFASVKPSQQPVAEPLVNPSPLADVAVPKEAPSSLPMEISNHKTDFVINPKQVPAATNLIRLPSTLGLAVSASTNVLHVEQPLKLLLAITNHGPLESGKVVLTNRLPANATFLSAETTAGTYQKTGDSLLFDLGTLPAGTLATAAVTLKFSAAGFGTNFVHGISSGGESWANDSSELVVLAKNSPPAISPVAPVRTRLNMPTAPIAFTVTDVETTSDQIRLFATSSDKDLLPDQNLLFTGSGSDRALIAVPSTGRSGNALVTITAIDSSGDQSSRSFQLSVIPDLILEIEPVEFVLQHPRIDQFERVNDRFSLWFYGEPGIVYTVEYTDSLFSQNWQVLTNIGVGRNLAAVQVSDVIGDQPQRFYRLKAATQNGLGLQGVSLSFNATAGQFYTIEYSDSLGAGSWQTLTNLGPVDIDGPVTVYEFNANGPGRFYRLRTP